MKKAIFFDRDGTLIIDKHYPNDPSNIEYFSDTFEVLQKLQDDGYALFIVTNQSGVAKGIIKDKQLEAIHMQMKKDFENHNIKITEYFSAPYLSTSDHYYRKPNPGMLKEAALIHQVDFSHSWMLGDKISDVEAGINVGCKTILITSKPETGKSYYQCKQLTEAYEVILKNSN